jgi:hypothetical protein
MGKNAKVAQLVERNLAKVEVASSRLVFRSVKNPLFLRGFLVKQEAVLPNKKSNAWVVELVDTQDLKSCAFTSVRVQVPSRVLRRTSLQYLRSPAFLFGVSSLINQRCTR